MSHEVQESVGARLKRARSLMRWGKEKLVAEVERLEELAAGRAVLIEEQLNRAERFERWNKEQARVIRVINTKRADLEGRMLTLARMLAEERDRSDSRLGHIQELTEARVTTPEENTYQAKEPR